MSTVMRNNVTISGAQERPPMMFVHGLATDQRIWRFVAPAFEAHHRLVLYDQVGFGGSDRTAYDPARHGSLHGFAADLLEICQEFELEDVVLVGHSAGAMIGMLAAIEEPERFAALIAIGASARYLDDEGYVGGFTPSGVDDLLEGMEHNYRAWCDHAASLFMGNPDRGELSDLLAATLREADPALARRIMETVLLSDHRDELPRVSTPSLVVQATEEPIAPLEAGQYLHEQLRDSELVLLRAAGHFPHVSAPAETIAVMHDFLARRFGEGQGDAEVGGIDELADLYEYAPFGYVSTDLDWRVTRINQTLLDWLGRSAERVVHRPFTDLLTDAGSSLHRMLVVPNVRLHGGLREISVDLARSDGSAMPALVSAEIREAEPNVASSIRVTILDAARRQRYEQELQAARQRYETRLRRLQQAVGDMAGAATVAEIAAVLSEALEEVFGAEGVTLWVLDAEGGLEAADGSEGRISMTTSRPEVAAMRTAELLIDADHQIVATAIRCGDRSVGVLALGFADANALQPDARELLRILAAHVGQAVDRAQAYEARGRLLSVVSHELRTPLTPIIGSSEYVLRRHPALPEELRRALEIIKRNGEHLVAVVDALLDLTRSRRGELLSSPRNVELGPFLRQLLDDLDAAQVDLDVPDEGAAAWVDPQHLRHVVANLLSNAERYGSPPISILVESDEATARVVVEDHGPGVDTSFVPHLFDEFTQADTGDRRSASGLGLGLAIARELVAASGGQLVYESRGDLSGARFVVTLPRRPPP